MSLRTITFAISVLLTIQPASSITIPQYSSREDIAVPLDTPENNLRRDTPTCGANSSLLQCPGTLSQFCCAANTQCLSLPTKDDGLAVLCCPEGQDCSTIQPVSCNTELQNSTLAPTSFLHADPIITLQPCNSQCCPPGFTCNGRSCTLTSNAVFPSTNGSATASPTGNASSTTDAPSSVLSLPSVPTTSAASSTPSTMSTPPSGNSQSGAFSGKAFAAGFVPGIALGALVAIGLVVFCSRRQGSRKRYLADGKHNSTGGDTLTDLGPTPSRHATLHGRSISEPTASAEMNYRTDFSNGSPLRRAGVDAGDEKMASDSHATPTSSKMAEMYMPTIKNMFSHSPFLEQTRTPQAAQSPIPDHLKRGTISFQISPVRALRKQRSFHSLRRHLTNATSRSNSSRRQQPHGSRTNSTETIQVLMRTPDMPRTTATAAAAAATTAAPMPTDTPDERNVGQSRDTVSTWRSEDTTPIDTEPAPFTMLTTATAPAPRPPIPPMPFLASASSPPPRAYASSSRYPTEVFTPTRVSAMASAGNVAGDDDIDDAAQPAALGTPYTPTKFWSRAKGGQGEAQKRVTTFSAMMESAGLRRSDYGV